MGKKKNDLRNSGEPKSLTKSTSRSRPATGLDASNRDKHLIAVTEKISDSYSGSSGDEDQTISSEVLSIARRISSKMHAPESPVLKVTPVAPLSASSKREKAETEQTSSRKSQPKDFKLLEDSDSGIEPSQWRPEPVSESIKLSKSSPGESQIVSGSSSDELLGSDEDSRKASKSAKSPKKARSPRKQVHSPGTESQTSSGGSSPQDVSSFSSSSDVSDSSPRGEPISVADGAFGGENESTESSESEAEITTGMACAAGLLR